MFIVRRLFGNIADRRWATVIGELLLLVVGVLLALAIDGWLQDQRDRRTEHVYLELISRDLQQTLVELDALKAFEASQRKAGLVAYRALSGPRADIDQQAISRILSRLGERRTTHVSDATYVDLLSTGNLQLISHHELRDNLLQFYESAERYYAIIDKNNAFFVDEMYNKQVLGQGLVLPRPMSDTPVLEEAEAAIRSELASGYIERTDAIWSLPENAPEWDIIRSALLMRIRISAIAGQLADLLIERVNDLQAAIEAELAGGE